MITSEDTEKAFEENWAPFHDKNTQHTRNTGNVFNFIKGIYEKYKVNILLNCERLIILLLRLGTR